jgi:hypothetical protein
VANKINCWLSDVTQQPASWLLPGVTLASDTPDVAPDPWQTNKYLVALLCNLSIQDLIFPPFKVHSAIIQPVEFKAERENIPNTSTSAEHNINQCDFFTLGGKSK